jgi:hypothetical protein
MMLMMNHQMLNLTRHQIQSICLHQKHWDVIEILFDHTLPTKEMQRLVDIARLVAAIVHYYLVMQKYQ